MNIEFTMEMNIPSATAQQIGIGIRSGRPYTYKKRKVRDAEELYALNLMEHRPVRPIGGAVELMVVWSYHTRVKKNVGHMKTTRPDLDNMNKILQDSLVREGFLIDDSQISVLHTIKCWTDKPDSIYISITSLEGVNVINKVKNTLTYGVDYSEGYLKRKQDIKNRAEERIERIKAMRECQESRQESRGDDLVDAVIELIKKKAQEDKEKGNE